jgi:hypothetical protein
MYCTFGRLRRTGTLLAATTLLLVACAPAASTPTKPTEAPKPAAASAVASPATTASPGVAASPVAAAPSPSVNPITTMSDVVPPPSAAAIKITSPSASGTVPAGNVNVIYDLNNITTVPAADAKKIDDLHVHVLLDVDPAPYIGTSVFIPPGNPNIIHTAAKEVTFNDVKAGQHKITVILTGANHISTRPPVTDTLTFTVQ